MFNFKYLLCCICLLMPCFVFAGVLKGKVIDDQGQTLPYATVFVEGTTMGVSANGNGDFELTLAPGTYKIVSQYIGYKQSIFTCVFIGDETKTHTFVLKDQSLEMKEVVIRANTEDPAYPIIRNAIKKRKFHLEQVRSFQTGIYLKGVARSRKLPEKIFGQKVKDEQTIVDSSGKGVLFLTEEDADYYSYGDKEKTIIHSVHESGNNSGLGFSQFPPVVTFYTNNVNMIGGDGRGFISPISDNALNYYKYKLEGEFQEHGNTIYKIKVTPKRTFEPCYTGTIYIVDEDWAIHSLDMTLAKQSGMDVFDTMKLAQIYLPLKKDTWIIKNQVQYVTVNLLGFDITANFVTVYNRQKVNEPIPDSIFAGKITSIYDRTANKKDSSYWKDSRPIPLEQDEKKDFVSKDSLYKLISAPSYLDSLRREANKIKALGPFVAGFSFSTKDYKNVYTTNSILVGLTQENMINYNIVEGFDIAPKLHWKHFVDTGKTLMGDMALRYGFSNKHFNSVARLYYVTRDREFPSRQWLYGIEGGQYVYQYNPHNPVSVWFNTYTALLYRQNELKLYERRDAAVYISRIYGTGISWMIKASYQQRLPLQNSTSYSFFDWAGNRDSEFKSNLPPNLLTQATAWQKHDAALIYASVSYRPGTTYTQYPDYKTANRSTWPLFTLTYDKGIPGIFNSITDFDKWRFNVTDQVSLRLLGNLKYNFVAGGFLNTNYVSIPDLMHLDGNRGLGYAMPYLQSFQFAPYYTFSNQVPLYGEAHIEYHLNGLLSNKIPLLRQARYYLLFGGNAFYANPNLYYTEAFIGIDNIGWKVFRLLRIDFVQSWDSYKGHNSGIRFGLNLPGVPAARNNPTQSEW